MQTKAALRQQLLDWRRSLSPEEIAEKSQSVCNQAYFGVDWSQVRSVCSYQVKHGTGELDPTPLLEKLRKLPSAPEIVLVQASQSAAIPKGNYDVIVVPVVGFTLGKHRLGQGGGWYDRFLAGQVAAQKIGLAYKETEVEFSSEKHDIALDVVFAV